MRRIISLILWITLVVPATFAQTKVIEGKVKDGHSDEVVPFASVTFKLAGTGKLADSSGAFIIRVPSDNDTLEITSVCAKTAVENNEQMINTAINKVGFMSWLVIWLSFGC